MIIKSIGRLSIQFPDGRIWEHTPGRFEIKTIGSEATGEGVEGEPVATLGGEEGSPRTSTWCRSCGQPGNPLANDQMICIRCWHAQFEIGGEFSASGYATEEFAQTMQQVVAPAFGLALDSTQSLGLAIQTVGQSLARVESDLKQRAG